MKLKLWRMSPAILLRKPYCHMHNPNTFHIQLPYDVICIIIRWVALSSDDFSTLKSLSLTNKTFYHEADKWIWRDVSLNWHVGRVQRFSRLDRKLDLLLVRPARASGINGLDIVINSRFPPKEKVRLRERIQTLMTKSTSLRVLKITDTMGEIDLSSMFLDNIRTYPFRLEELALCNIKLDADSLCEALAFIPSIHCLFLGGTSISKWSAETFKLPSTSLPSLSAIHAPLHLLLCIIDSRPVSCISTSIPESSATSLLFSAISSSTTPTTSLTLELHGGSEISSYLLSQLPIHTMSLRFLSLRGSLSSRGTPSQNAYTPLKSLEHLECIRWRGTRLGVFLHLVEGVLPPCTYAGKNLKLVQWEVPMEERMKAEEIQEGVWVRKSAEFDSEGDPISRLNTSLTESTLVGGQDSKGRRLGLGSELRLFRTNSTTMSVSTETEHWMMYPRKTVSPPWDPSNGYFDPLALVFAECSSSR